MLIQKFAALTGLAVAVEVSPDGLLKWFASAAVAFVGFLVLREVDRIVKAVSAANAGVAGLRTEIAVLKNRVSQLEAHRRP